MIRSLFSAATGAALLFSFTACSAPPSDTEPRYTVPEPSDSDPAVAAKEAEYREQLDAGRKALDARNTDAAVTHLEKATGANPQGVDAHLALAQALVAKKDSEKAIRAYTAALALNPRLPDAALECAALQERANRLEDARLEYTRLIGQAIDSKVTAKAYWLRSGVADRLGRRADYRYDREQALKLDSAYASQITGGDVIVFNDTDLPCTVTLDRVVSLDGAERTLASGNKFTFSGRSSAYLMEDDRPITAKRVKVTVTIDGRSRTQTATYEQGMSLEVHILP